MNPWKDSPKKNGLSPPLFHKKMKNGIWIPHLYLFVNNRGTWDFLNVIDICPDPVIASNAVATTPEQLNQSAE